MKHLLVRDVFIGHHLSFLVKYFSFLILLFVASSFQTIARQERIDLPKNNNYQNNLSQIDTSNLSTLVNLCEKYLKNNNSEKLLQTIYKLDTALAKIYLTGIQKSNSVYQRTLDKYTAKGQIYYGIYYIGIPDYSKALKHFFACEKLMIKINDKKGLANTYNNIGFLFQSQSNYSQALKYHTKSLGIRLQIKDSLGISDSYNSIAYIYYDQNEFDMALENNLKALSIREKLKDKKLLAGSLNNIGSIYKDKGEWDKAMSYYTKSYLISKSTGSKIGEVYYYNNLGNIMNQRGKYPEAIELYFKAYELSKLLDRKVSAEIMVNIGSFYSERGKYDLAIKYFRYSLNIFSELNNRKRIMNTYTYIGSVYLKKSDFIQSKYYLNKSLKLANELNDVAGKSEIYFDLGMIDQNNSNYVNAINYFNLALNNYKTLNSKEQQAKTYYQIGECNSLQFNYDQAIANLNNAIGIALGIELNPLIVKCYQLLSTCYNKIADYKSAYGYLSLRNEIADSIFNLEARKKLLDIETKYETLRKEDEIKLLTKDKIIINQQIAEQRINFNYLFFGSLFFFIAFTVVVAIIISRRRIAFKHQMIETEMKALRSQMNHHFTFNVLNSIQYYVVKNDFESVEYYLEKFSSLIRMILDQSRNPYVSLEVELRMINLYIELEEMRFEKQFDYSIEVNKNIIPEEIMIPGMLIQPVIENAIKHGIEHKEGEAMVTIVFDIIDSTLICTVRDNGIGRSESELHKLNPNKTSAGSSILEERLKALSYIFKIKLTYTVKDLVSDDGKPLGTLVTLQIPYIQL